MPTHYAFEEDKEELEAHFAERVKAYIELGETQEQAQASAREKFGHTEPVLRELGWQRVRKQPVMVGVQTGLLWLAGYLPLALPIHAGFARWQHSSQSLGEQGPSLYLWVAVEALLAFFPATLSATLMSRRSSHNNRAIFLGILVASVLGGPVHDPLTALFTAVPAGLGTLGCITLQRSRKLQKKV